jgi:chorismate mutase
MSPSSRESDLAQLREALLQLNTQFFQILEDRRELTQRIQGLKDVTGRYAHFDPEREKVLFHHVLDALKKLTLKELLAFSLVMEDQAMSMAPGSYPSWSSGIHLQDSARDLPSMINPLLLKITHPELFNRLFLAPDFSFLKQF